MERTGAGFPCFELNKPIPQTGIHYLTLVAYFQQSVLQAHLLVEEVAKRCSELSGPLDGWFQASFQDDRPLVRHRATLGEYPLSIALGLGEGNVFTSVLFEATRKVKVSEGFPMVHRPQVLVQYCEVAPVYGRDPLPVLISLTCQIEAKYVVNWAPSDQLAWFRRFWCSVALADPCAFGIVDFDNSDLGGGGGEYDRGGDGPVAWQRRMESWRFLMEPDRLQKLRGVYWGNYLGAALASKLGDSSLFLAEFNSLSRRYGESSPIGVRNEDGGIWLQSNCNILVCKPSYYQAYEDNICNAVWLEKRLRSLNLIW